MIAFPETRNKTIDEIYEKLSRKKKDNRDDRIKAVPQYAAFIRVSNGDEVNAAILFEYAALYEWGFRMAFYENLLEGCDLGKLPT